MEETLQEKRAKKVVTTLREAGHQAFFAGGAVRDRLLGTPPQDVDVATSATPDQVVRLFPKTVPVGVTFGVILVLVDGDPIEVATFRSEGGYFDGRHPSQVTFSSAEEDVKRRDFTINGLLYDPLKKEVLDYVGGRQDLQQGVLRAIGDPRQHFGEDRLRMWRAVRFASRLGFQIHPDTWEALVELGATTAQVSAERVREELLKILTGPRAAKGVGALYETGMLQVWLPEVVALRGVPQPKMHHPEGDVWAHTIRCLQALERLSEKGPPPSEALALAALLHDVGKAETTILDDTGRPRAPAHAAHGAALVAEVAKRLRLSTALKKRVVALVEDHGKPLHAREMRRSKLIRLLRAEHFQELLALHRIDRLGGSGDLSTYEFLREAFDSLRHQELHPPPLLKGRDLVEMGYTPGPSFGQALEALEEAQLEKSVSTVEEAKRLVEEILGAPPHP